MSGAQPALRPGPARTGLGVHHCARDARHPPTARQHTDEVTEMVLVWGTVAWFGTIPVTMALPLHDLERGGGDPRFEATL
ncbi:hypothetical protein SAMD00023353_0202060 [Rosellinia necatrix]|uniref:Uncharacterized protein n=1 Tax=Rosellinia necatrix TaxID=77044 RepID=A0A1S8A621_ROSNE|nr:hypothetical protein SAMD00023353_0202060 [Rosellinia necatrix]